MLVLIASSDSSYVGWQRDKNQAEKRQKGNDLWSPPGDLKCCLLLLRTEKGFGPLGTQDLSVLYAQLHLCLFFSCRRINRDLILRRSGSIVFRVWLGARVRTVPQVQTDCNPLGKSRDSCCASSPFGEVLYFILDSHSHANIEVLAPRGSPPWYCLPWKIPSASPHLHSSPTSPQSAPSFHHRNSAVCLAVGCRA